MGKKLNQLVTQLLGLGHIITVEQAQLIGEPKLRELYLAQKKKVDERREKVSLAARKFGVGDLAFKLLDSNPKISFKEMNEAVMKEFPNSKFNKTHFYWYRSHNNKNGKEKKS